MSTMIKIYIIKISVDKAQHKLHMTSTGSLSNIKSDIIPLINTLHVKN
jgi:hypothetical protein